MGFIDPLPESLGYDTTLVIVDKSTKCITAIPVNKEIDTSRLIKILNKEAFLYFGLLKYLTSDRVILLTSNEFRE